MFLAGVGFGIVLTVLFGLLPLLLAIVFYFSRRRKFGSVAKTLPYAALLAGLFQLLLSLPFIADVTSDNLLNDLPIKNRDYQVYNLVSGLVIFIAIWLYWRASNRQNTNNDQKLATHLLLISGLVLIVQLSGALKYEHKLRSANLAARSEQVYDAQHFGTEIYIIPGLESKDVRLSFAEFINQDGIQTYRQNYEQHPYALAYQVSEINLAGTDLVAAPCAIRESDLQPNPAINCEQIGSNISGFNIYKELVTAFDHTRILGLYFQKMNTRIQITSNSPLNGLDQNALARSMQQVSPEESWHTDYYH